MCARWAYTQLVEALKMGCEAYVLIPKAKSRKDWKDKAMLGYFIGYSEMKAWYHVTLGDTLVTSVHVLFDEAIPKRSADYLRGSIRRRLRFILRSNK